MKNNRCVICGEIIPEGKQVCPSCEKSTCNTCKHWDRCRGMMQAGSNCYEASDKTVVSNTISAMLEKFGEDSQIDVCIEEMSELIKELIKYKRSKIHFREKQNASRNNVVEEISDVLFMMEYLKEIFGISQTEIDVEIRMKAQRTKERYIDGD